MCACYGTTMENQKRNNRAGDSYPIGKQSCRSKPGPCNIRCDDGGVEIARNTITEISTIRIRGKNRIIGFCVKGCGNATRPVISGGTAWLNPRRSSDRPTITPCNNWEASFNHRRVSLPGLIFFSLSFSGSPFLRVGRPSFLR